MYELNSNAYFFPLFITSFKLALNDGGMNYMKVFITFNKPLYNNTLLQTIVYYMSSILVVKVLKWLLFQHIIFIAEKGLKSFKILKVIVYYIVVSLGFIKLAAN